MAGGGRSGGAAEPGTSGSPRPGGGSVHAAADAWAWLEPRLSGVPAPLAREIRACLEASVRPASSPAEALAVAALEALDGLVDGAPDREAALRLLAADACLVTAFEAAAEGEGEDPAELAAALGPSGSLGRRLAAALREAGSPGTGLPEGGEVPGARLPDGGEVPGGAPGEETPGAGPAREETPDAGAYLAEGLGRLAAAARAAAPGLRSGVERYAAWVRETLSEGGTLFFAGNGGSAATAEHVAAEYVARFRRNRRPLSAVALPGSAAALTASANDFGFREVYARALRALARPGDLAVLHSTSGNSANLVRAAAAAAELGVRTVGLLAADGGRLRELVDLALVVPTGDPAVAQELHLAVEHAVVSWTEAVLDGPR